LATTTSLNVHVVFAIIHKNGVVINAIYHYALHDCSCHGHENCKDDEVIGISLNLRHKTKEPR